MSGESGNNKQVQAGRRKTCVLDVMPAIMVSDVVRNKNQNRDALHFCISPFQVHLSDD